MPKHLRHKPNNASMTATLVLVVLLIGFFAGVMSGLIGVGGGIVLVPALVIALGYTQQQAQGTSLGVLCLPVVALAFWRYYQNGKAIGAPLNLYVILLLAAAFVIGAYLGSGLAIKINNNLLRKIFGLVLLYVSVKMLGLDQMLIKSIKKIVE